MLKREKFALLFLLHSCAFCLSQFDSYSQEKYSNPTSQRSPNTFVSNIEVFAGPTVVGLHGNSVYKEYGVTKVGYAAGIGLHNSLSTHLRLNTRIYYEHKGFNLRVNALIPPDYYNDPPTTNLPSVPTDLESDFDIDYVSLSIQPCYYVGPSLKLHFGAGLYYSKLVKAGLTQTDIQDGEVKRKTTNDQKDQFKNQDYGICFTAGYLIDVREAVRIRPQVYYSIGLANVIKTQPGLESQEYYSFGLLISLSIIKN